MEELDTMAGKPYQSCLIPHEDEIVSLRERRPPMPYAQIAERLRQTHNLRVRRETIFKFIKVRSRGRKVYSYQRSAAWKKSTYVRPVSQLADPRPDSKQPPKPLFDFKFSDRYNLTRLPPEEAAARRKKTRRGGPLMSKILIAAGAEEGPDNRGRLAPWSHIDVNTGCSPDHPIPLHNG
jgi:hypothetical protein